MSSERLTADGVAAEETATPAATVEDDEAVVTADGGVAEPEAAVVDAVREDGAEAAADIEEPRDYLDDLRRLQADFENYRKRMMREQTALTARATERLLEQLLPVLDNFERAVAHGATEGVALVYRQLQDVLTQEGLEEVAAEGVAFDPSVHEAVELKEDPAVHEATCTAVLRRGYRIGGKLLRPAMVTVARPPDEQAAAGDPEDEPGEQSAAAAGEA